MIVQAISDFTPEILKNCQGIDIYATQNETSESEDEESISSIKEQKHEEKMDEELKTEMAPQPAKNFSDSQKDEVSKKNTVEKDAVV